MAVDDLKQARIRRNKRTARETLAQVREAIALAERALAALRARERACLELLGEEGDTQDARKNPNPR